MHLQQIQLKRIKRVILAQTKNNMYIAKWTLIIVHFNIYIILSVAQKLSVEIAVEIIWNYYFHYLSSVNS